ncbi:MAG: mycofactocin biosynthesis glycosyltransferase MftF, partial [Acidimicrobiales bacterium]
SDSGRTAFDEIRRGRVESPPARLLGRKLTDVGIAHPNPAELDAPLDVTVLIPARDRVHLLERTLKSVGPAVAVIVVDDGSADAAAVAETATRHGATLVVRPESGGPGVARCAGLEHVHTDFVAFLDSDCIAPEGWLARLAAHFVDPMVAAVAPRIVASPSATTVGHYSAARGPLDMGERPARVMPGTRVPYVPTAALVVRRRAVDNIARDRHIFNPGLRYGEDVDFIWRLHDAGWRIRFDPSVEVLHSEPETWRDFLIRRFRYGTSAAPLSSLHPNAVSPLVLHPWPTLIVGSLLAGRPRLTAAGFAGSVAWIHWTLRQSGLPTRSLVRSTTKGAHQTWLGLGRYATQFAAPVLAAAAIFSRSGARRSSWGRRVSVASLLIGPPVSKYLSSQPTIGPVRFVSGHVADDVAYGAGVWAGCLRHRTIRPLCPRPLLPRGLFPRGRGRQFNRR